MSEHHRGYPIDNRDRSGGNGVSLLNAVLILVLAIAAIVIWLR